MNPFTDQKEDSQKKIKCRRNDMWSNKSMQEMIIYESKFPRRIAGSFVNNGHVQNFQTRFLDLGYTRKRAESAVED